jgi:RNA polymerase sigma-70 factor (ECF subfamily)
MTDKVFDLAALNIAPRLSAYFRRRIRDSASINDLVQDTLLKAYRSRGALRDDTRFESWLFQIAHGTMVDHYRRKPTVGLRADTTREAPGEKDRVIEILECSAQCYLETLPKKYRDPVHLAEYEGLSHAEIARQLGVTLAAAKSRIRRGKLMVRSLMEARCEFQRDVLGRVISYRVRGANCALSETCK